MQLYSLLPWHGRLDTIVGLRLIDCKNTAHIYIIIFKNINSIIGWIFDSFSLDVIPVAAW